MTSRISLDFIITGVKSTINAIQAREYLLERSLDHKRIIKANVMHLIGHQEFSTHVTELEWLLNNASEADFILELSVDDVQKVESTALHDIICIIDKFKERYEALDNVPHIQIPMKIPPFKGLWYKTKLRRRVIRYMSNKFNGLPKVALLVPMTLKGLRNSGTIPLLCTLAPALEKTFSHCFMNRGLYLGIDEDEQIPAGIIKQIQLRFKKVLKITHERTIKFPKKWRSETNMARMYNELFKYAIMDGYDFAVQLQDDARPETSTWDKLLGSYLCLNPSAIGAYSMKDRINTQRMNNIMVSRSHFDLFGYMFNPACMDPATWIKQVLGSYSKVVPKCKVTNTIRDRRSLNGTSHMYMNYGQTNEAVISKDREGFENAIQGLM